MSSRPSNASQMSGSIPRSASSVNMSMRQSQSRATGGRQQAQQAQQQQQQQQRRDPSPELPRLHELVRQQDFKGLVAHLDRVGYLDINTLDHKGRTALHLACIAPNPEVVRLLLRRGAYIHALTDRNQLSALHCACIKGNIESARVLMKYGADPNLENADGITPLQLLPKNNREAQKFAKAVLTLPSLDAQKASKKDKELLARVVVGDEKGLLDLIDKGADINVVEEKTLMTPLMFACRNANEDLVRTLLFHCADVHRQDVAKNTALHWAAAKGNRPIVEMLVDFDASVNITDRENGYTPLHWAVNKNHVELVPLLVAKYRANPNLPDKEGLTALHLACRKTGMVNMVETLLTLPGLEVDVPDAYGVRPLHIAVRKNDLRTVDVLLRVGKADPNVPSVTGVTPLHDACEEPNADIVKALVTVASYPVDLNAKTSEGNTALHVVISNLERKHNRRSLLAIVDIIKLLVSKGADVNAKNFHNRTPLLCLDVANALREGTSENIIARTLVSVNADVTLLHRIVFNRDIPQQVKDQIKDLVEYLQRKQLQDQREQNILQRLPPGWRQVTENGETFFVDENNVRSVPPATFLLANDPRMAPQSAMVAAVAGRAAAAAAAAASPHVDDDDEVSQTDSSLSLQELSCPLCLELLYKPCTTECGHNFCQPCLEEAFKFHQHCPVCRKNVKASAAHTVNAMFATIVQKAFPERYAQRAADYQRMVQTQSTPFRA